MFENKKGQITFFIIIGIVLLSAFLLIRWIHDNKVNDIQDEIVKDGFSINFDKASIENYYTECIRDIADKALLEYPPQKVGPYIKENIADCSGIELSYPGIKFSYGEPEVDVRKNEYGTSLIVDVDYPIVLDSGLTKATLSSFSVKIPLIEKAVLSLDNDGLVKEDTILEMIGGEMNLLVRKGTKVTNDEKIVSEITYAIREAHDGNVVIDLKPDGTTFNKPLILRISLDSVDIPIGFDKSRLSAGRYDPDTGRYVLIGATFFDPLTDELVVPIKHFSMFTWGIIRNDSRCNVSVNTDSYSGFIENITRYILDEYSYGSSNEIILNSTVDKTVRHSKKYGMNVSWFVNVNGSFGFGNLTDFNFSVDISNITVPLDGNLSLFYDLKNSTYHEVMNHTNASVDNQSINKTIEDILSDAIYEGKTNLIINNTLFNQTNLTNFSLSIQINFTGMRPPTTYESCKEELGFEYEFEFGEYEFGVCANENCRGITTTDQTSIEVKEAGRYMVFGLVERGQYDTCQMNEMFYMELNEERTSISQDGSCDNTKEWEEIGQLNFIEGNNVLKMVYAGGTTGLAESVEIWKIGLGAMSDSNAKYYWIDNFGTQHDVEYLKELKNYPVGVTTTCQGNSSNRSSEGHSTNFLTAGCYTHLLPGKDKGWRDDCIQKLKSKGYSHIYLYAANEGDYDGTIFNFYDDPQEFKTILDEVNAAGLKPVVWLIPDDAPKMKSKSTDEIKKMFDRFILVIDDSVSSYVLGLEMDEYWKFEKVNELGNYLNTLTQKDIGVHMTVGKLDYCTKGKAWCDQMYYQYGFKRTESQMTADTKNAISRLGGITLIAAEYSYREDQTKSVKLGDAAMAAGAKGFGNGGTSSGAPVGICGNNKETIDITEIQFINSDEEEIRDWPITTTLEVKKVTSSGVSYSFDKSKEWPGRDLEKNNVIVNGNIYIIWKEGGVWKIASFDWIRVGATFKDFHNLEEFNIHPESGSTVGFMTTGFSRGSLVSHNVEERSNIDTIEWP